MRFLSKLLSFFLLSVSVGAATLYCNNAGGGSGADFNNLATLPNTTGFVRGNIYIIVDDTYTPRTFSTAESGTTPITIRKASAANSGVAGYAASLHDGEALITHTSWPVISFLSDYWVIDGVVGAGKASTTYGIRLHSTAARSSGGTLCLWNAVSTEVRRGLDLSYINYDWDNGTALGSNQERVAHIESSAGNEDCRIANSYLHHSNAYSLHMGNITGRPESIDLLVERNHFYKNGGGGGADKHNETFWYTDHVVSIFRYNVIEDSYGSADSQTGWLMLGNVSNVQIYGNLFCCTSGDCFVGNNGIIATWSEDTYVNSDVSIINNSFVDIAGGSGIRINFDHNTANDSNIVLKNNLYYGATGSFVDIDTHTHGAFGGGITANGTSTQTGLATSIFTDYANDVFTLASGTTAGDSTVGSDYNTDPSGATRGGDGTWDRGFDEFGSGGGAEMITIKQSGGRKQRGGRRNL